MEGSAHPPLPLLVELSPADARPLVTIAMTVRHGISKRSHEKIEDCEQSSFYIIGEIFRTNVDSVNF